MIDDPKALQRMMDDYADGRLDPEHMCALVEQLRHSAPAREQLAVVAVAERLLRASGQGGVPAGRIMAHLAEAGVLPADPDVPPRRSGRRRNTMRRAAGAGLRARAVASARDRNVQTHRRLPLWLLLGVLVAVAVAVGLWRQGHQNERAVLPPPLGDGSDDPGFVPPPPRVRERRPASPHVGTAGETVIPGGGTTPMASTEARTPPKPPVFVTKIKEE